MGKYSNKKIKIVVNWIVKNEGAIIERSLSSVEPVADFISVCDTGSTDNTVEIIKRWATEREIPCVVHEVKESFKEYLESVSENKVSPWQDDWQTKYQDDPDWIELQKMIHSKDEDSLNLVLGDLLKEQHTCYPLRLPEDTTFQDFGYNRSQSFNLARQSFPEADYVMLCDADISYRISPKFGERELNGLGYRIHQKTTSSEFDSVKLLATVSDWKCECKTHEYWSCPDGYVFSVLPSDEIWIEDFGDGGCKTEKYSRDIRLLKEVLEETEEIYYQGLRQRQRPREASRMEKTRAYYYLAQTYTTTREYNKSIHFYKECLKLSNWSQERWSCLHKIALNHKWLYISEHGEKMFPDDINYILMMHYFKKAHEYRPTRVETPYECLRFHVKRTDCENKRMLRTLCKYASYIINNPEIIERGKKDILFVETKIYQDCQGMAEYTLSYLAFYLGKYDIGLKATDSLISKEDAIPFRKKLATINRKFYVEKLALEKSSS